MGPLLEPADAWHEVMGWGKSGPRMTYPKGDSMIRNRRFVVSTLAIVGLALTACPADDEEDMTTNVTATMTATDTADPTATGTDTMDTMDETGMGGSTGEPETSSETSSTDLSHAADIQPIWDQHCVEGCHEPSGTWALVDLSPEMAYISIVGETGTQTISTGMNLIEPGSLDDSYLWHKLKGTHVEAGGSGVSMPANDDLTAGDPLDDATLDIIAEWIEGGAPP